MMDPSDANESIVLRYIQVGESYYPEVRHPSIATDGVRVAGKDVYTACLGGLACGGTDYVASWDIKV